MDHCLPVVSDDGDLSWSDSYSMVSDDSRSVMIANSPLCPDSLPTSSVSASTSSTMSISQTGQLSPVSTGVDVRGERVDNRACHFGSSSASNTAHSASSFSHMDSWSGEDLDIDDVAETGIGDGSRGPDDLEWRQDGDDGMMVPKLEPVDDDDFRLDDVKEAPLTPLISAVPTPAQPKLKRPRGRPRKHPQTPLAETNKVTKGRSKTGCLTCRKRKKKCDEAKPRCMNCEKNAVVCEGYPEKHIWRSGRERAEEERLGLRGYSSITMQPIFHGLETAEDHIFWKHYNEHLSTVLTVEGEHKNAFRNMVVPIAVKHEGLMHSILSLASKHLDYDTPYGANILRGNPATSIEALQHRSDFHHEKAVEKLYTDIAKEVDKTSPEYKDILSAQYGQMLCLLLESKAEGNPRGEHRVHLQAYQAMIKHSPPTDPAFLTFITEFFQYHIFADELFHVPDSLDTRLAYDHWTPASPLQPPRLLGVADGLFSFLSQITTIRNAIRNNMLALADPVVDYDSLYMAAEVDLGIRQWTPRWPPGDSRNRVGLLYKLMMSVYLLQTIYPPSPATAASSLSSLAVPSWQTVPLAGTSADEYTSPVYTPPKSTSSSCASSPKIAATSVLHHDGGRAHALANPTSRKNGNSELLAMPGYDTVLTRTDSPAPARHPSQHDPRITATVSESLDIMETFKPSDPSQTLLLLPCLVIGAASFIPAQRDRIRTAVRTVRGYTGMRNTDHVAHILEKLWHLMDAGEWAIVWDWQSVASRMGVDCVIA